MTEDKAGTTQWHERTVERSLKAARERAISRGDRFIAAAASLLRTTGKPDFTVQEVVDQSGMSLRSFYHHFATKDDLLLALVEETTRQFVEVQRPKVAAVDDPVEKLRAMLTTAFDDERPDDPASRGIVLFLWRLADSRSEEFATALRPQTDLVAEILELGADAGAFRTDISVPVLASLVTNTMVSLLDMRVLGIQLTDENIVGEDLVKWFLAGVVAPT